MFIVNLFVAARQALAEWRRRHQAYAELMALDDRSLADIGIRRSEIPGIIERSRPSGKGQGKPRFGFTPRHAYPILPPF